MLLIIVSGDTSEDIIPYNQLLESFAKDDTNDVVWKFKRIKSHQGPLPARNPIFNGSTFNIIVEW
jgi:hypothetical protein